MGFIRTAVVGAAKDDNGDASGIVALLARHLETPIFCAVSTRGARTAAKPLVKSRTGDSTRPAVNPARCKRRRKVVRRK